MNKKAQLMLWVILAIFLVAAMILFLYIDRKPTITTNQEFNPESYMDKCVRQYVDEVVEKMLPQWGFVNPENTKTYNGINVTYLCQNKGNYLPCVNQHPMLLNEMKSEIINYIQPKIEKCFSDFKTEVEKRDGKVEYGITNMNLNFGPKRIYIFIDKKTTMAFGEETRNIPDYRIEIINPLYDLASVAIEIASQEANYCYFEYVGYMILHPEFKITKFTFDDSTKVYTIEDKSSSKKINIAVRGCAIPPGI